MGIPFMADSIGKLHQPTGPSSSCLRKSYRLPVTMCLFLGGGRGGAEIMATVANHWSPRSLWQWLAWWLANEMKKNVCLEGFWEWFSPNQKQKLWGNSSSSLESAVSSMWCCFFLWEEGQTDQERHKDSTAIIFQVFLRVYSASPGGLWPDEFAKNRIQRGRGGSWGGDTCISMANLCSCVSETITTL